VFAAAHNSGNNGAPSFDMAQLKRSERISCGRSTVFGAGWYAHSAAGNWSFDSGSVRVILSTKNRCVVAANVSRNNFCSLILDTGCCKLG
jgi:hypothetical protein